MDSLKKIRYVYIVGVPVNEEIIASCERYGVLPFKYMEEHSQLKKKQIEILALIESADVVIVNIQALARNGAKIDENACYEMGCASMLGKPVYGWDSNCFEFSNCLNLIIQQGIDNVRETKEPISPKEVKEKASFYYGKRVNYIAKGMENNTWLLFYSDSENIYLISERVIPNKYLGDWFRCDENHPYSVYVSSGREELMYRLLLDVKKLKDVKGYAKKATLAPTLEMFCNSWNDIQDFGNELGLQYMTEGKFRGSSGGYLIKSDREWEYYADLSRKNCKLKNMYFTNPSDVEDTKSFRYWVASPSYSGFNDKIFSVDYRCHIYPEDFNSFKSGVRPIITLKSNVGLGESGANGYELTFID